MVLLFVWAPQWIQDSIADLQLEVIYMNFNGIYRCCFRFSFGWSSSSVEYLNDALRGWLYCILNSTVDGIQLDDFYLVQII